MKHSVYNLLELKAAVSQFDEHQEKTPEEQSKEENKEKEESKEDTFFSVNSSLLLFIQLDSASHFKANLNSLLEIKLFSPPPECLIS